MKKDFSNVMTSFTRGNKVRSMAELLEDRPPFVPDTPTAEPAQEVKDERAAPEAKIQPFSPLSPEVPVRQPEIFSAGEGKKVQKAQKVIRDGFSMPHEDYKLLKMLKMKAFMGHIETNKSEILRAGLQCLNRLSAEEFLRVIADIDKIKPGKKKETV